MSLKTAGVDKKSKPGKLVIGVLGAAITALVGFAGIANASPGQPNTGNGYGGQQNVNIETNLNIDVEGDNNVIHVVIQYIFGGGS